MNPSRPHDEPASTSPSLRAGGAESPPACELKFLVDGATAAAVEAWARRELQLDPHGDPAARDSYLATTRYLDTAALDVYHRAAGFARRKYRIRRYGAARELFLERKIRHGDRVRKRRVAVTEPARDGLEALLGAAGGRADWFGDEVAERLLQPSCLISYRRTAFFAREPDGAALRLTLDRDVHGQRTREWDVQAVERGAALLAGSVVCELKFAGALPPRFRELVARFALAPAGVSKYRRCLDAFLHHRDGRHDG